MFGSWYYSTTYMCMYTSAASLLTYSDTFRECIVAAAVAIAYEYQV